MSKYLNADKLIIAIKELKNRLISSMNKFYYAANYKEWKAELRGYNTILRLIAILQQERQAIIDSICSGAGISVPYKDGNQWCILKGDDIQQGVAGFGNTPEDALMDFIKNVPVQQMQPEEQLNPDLEQEVEKFCLEYDARKEIWFDMTSRDQKMLSAPTWSNFAVSIANHFWNKGYNARKKKEIRK